MMRFLSLFLFVLLALSSCKKDEETYARKPARLTIDNVLQAPVLQTACISNEQFCFINTDNTGQKFVFTNAEGKTSYINLTALTGYSGFYLGISGLIVGLPSIPEMGKDVPMVVCFDRACSNCYENSHIAKPLEFQSQSYVYCKTCKRTYDLNSVGIVSKGDGGRSLYRYRVSYMNNVLVVSN